MLISNQLKSCKETQAKKAINEKVTEKLSAGSGAGSVLETDESGIPNTATHQSSSYWNPLLLLELLRRLSADGSGAGRSSSPQPSRASS
jgi:hypothetical protein